MEYILKLSLMTVIFTAILGFVIYIAMLIMARFEFILTYCQQNHVRAIMRGEDFDHFIENIKGQKVDDDGAAEPATDGDKDDPRDQQGFWGWLLKKMGMYWVGLPPRNVLKFRLRWNKYTKVGGTGSNDYALEPRDETVGSILFQTVYPVEIREVELTGNIKVNFLLLVTVEVKNFFRAFFGILPTGNFINFLTSTIQTGAKETGGKISFDDLRNEFKENKSSFEEHLKKTRNELLLREIGHEIVSVQFVAYQEISDEEVKKALRAKEIAKLNAEGVREKAEGERDAKKTVAEGEAYHLKIVGKEMEDNPRAAELRRLQAIENSNLVTPGGGGDNLLFNIPVSPKKEKED